MRKTLGFLRTGSCTELLNGDLPTGCPVAGQIYTISAANLFMGAALHAVNVLIDSLNHKRVKKLCRVLCTAVAS